MIINPGSHDAQGPWDPDKKKYVDLRYFWVLMPFLVVMVGLLVFVADRRGRPQMCPGRRPPGFVARARRRACAMPSEMRCMVKAVRASIGADEAQPKRA